MKRKYNFDSSHRPTLEQMDECLRVFHLEPKPLVVAAEDLLNALATWTANDQKINMPDSVNDAYSILRQAIAATYEKGQTNG